MVVDVRHQQRAAVAGLLGDVIGGNYAGRAGLVFDQHGGVPYHRELPCGDARQNVGATARREADDDADRPARQVLRSQHGCGQCGHRSGCGIDKSSAMHDFVSILK